MTEALRKGGRKGEKKSMMMVMLLRKPQPSGNAYALRNISTGMGFRRRPELADVSPLSAESQLCRLGERQTTAGGVLECGVR